MREVNRDVLPTPSRRRENFRVNALNTGGNGVCLTQEHYRKAQNRLTMKTVMQLGSTPAALLSYGFQGRKQGFSLRAISTRISTNLEFAEVKINNRLLIIFLRRSVTKIKKLLKLPVIAYFLLKQFLISLFTSAYFTDVNSLRLMYCYFFMLCVHFFISFNLAYYFYKISLVPRNSIKAPLPTRLCYLLWSSGSSCLRYATLSPEVISVNAILE